MSKSLIVIGGGNSIREFSDLWISLKGHEIMAVNHAYRFLIEPPKYQISMDRKFWKNNYADMERIANAGTTIINRNNELPVSKTFEDNSFFCSERKLSGVFALSYATKRLKQYSHFFLLGYDFGPFGGKTHFYDDVSHPGIGKLRAYLDDFGAVLPAVKDFDHFKDFDISLVGQSNIKSFPKITYEKFLEELQNGR